MRLDLERYKELAHNKAKENKAFVTRLRKKKPKTLDGTVLDAHVEVFERLDCLDCANCCQTISPIVTDRDIDRMAKHLKMKRPALIDQYFELDEDHDYVFKETPCPFLMNDNYCMIYEVRPRACREYPHTDRKRFYQILNLTYRNSFVCPAVYEVLETMKRVY
ncbi:flagellin N-methylase [Saccharicrinis fermentans DSM 9555 = JCM 21142]|uniref:Flagellin N-methylase n=2 Tax=Saccharicrinis fermentans TaxID=982 RepID=W7Y3K8_9BACT|nr:flagellin N-methylase [Saccharicrinis fermentans DSM 9555 = JCM 21142]